MTKKSNTEFPVEQYPFQIKNWAKFQHYRYRKPPWIRLYRDLLEDPEFHAISPLAAKCLIMLWLIASETEGYLPASKLLAFRLRISENEISSIISELSHFVYQRASTALARGYQHATPEYRVQSSDTSKLRLEAAAPPEAEPLTEPPFDLGDDPPPVPEAPRPSLNGTKTPKAALYAEAKRIIGPRGGPAIGKLIKFYGEDYPRLHRVLALAEASSDPGTYVFGVIAQETKKSKQDELDRQQIEAWRPLNGLYPLDDARGFYIKSEVDGKTKLYLDGERVQKLVGEERMRRGTI